jgi:hypothetical protein
MKFINGRSNPTTIKKQSPVTDSSCLFLRKQNAYHHAVIKSLVDDLENERIYSHERHIVEMQVGYLIQDYNLFLQKYFPEKLHTITFMSQTEQGKVSAKSVVQLVPKKPLPMQKLNVNDAAEILCSFKN